MRATLDKDLATSTEEALLEFYRRLRPGDPPNHENARNLLNSLFFNFRRYDLGRVGSYKLNKRLVADIPMTERVLTPRDLTEIVSRMIEINNGQGRADDIDHLGNRRVRAVGELIQNQFRIGLLRMERVVKERMTIQEADQATPAGLINIRPVVAAMREFFGGQPALPVHGPDEPSGRVDAQAKALGTWAQADSAGTGRASRFATFTTATTDGSARSRLPRVPTSV